jgi:hypothetical protein
MDMENDGKKIVLPVRDFIYDQKDLLNAACNTGELKPCPFCGSRALSSAFDNEQTHYIVYRVFCQNHGCLGSVSACLGPIDTKDACREEVVRRWNSRINN